MTETIQKAKKNYTKVDVADIQLGVRYSAPVFFDDGENMFLAEGKTAKPYHIAALKRWSIPYLLTFGHIINEAEAVKMSAVDDAIDDIEELEELEELEEEVV